MESLSSARRVQRVRYDLRQRDVEVVRVEPVGASFVGITFSGEALADFETGSFDDHVKFTFVEASGELVRRDYTPRRFDRKKRELTIEFVLHGDGGASDWARRAVAGQRAVIAGPRGSMIVPMDYDWHLLVGDVTALPAIRRRLEELPAGARVIVVGLAADAADQCEFVSAVQVDARWVSSPEEMIAVVRALSLPDGEGFAWCAGESSAMRRLREVLLVEKAHPKEALRVAAYWREGAAGFHERLDA